MPINSNELFITYCNLKDLKGINFDDFVSADDDVSTEIVKSDVDIMSSNTHIIDQEEEILDLIEPQPKPVIKFNVALNYIYEIKRLFLSQGLDSVEIESR
jgi:hypothetical protein